MRDEKGRKRATNLEQNSFNVRTPAEIAARHLRYQFVYASRNRNTDAQSFLRKVHDYGESRRLALAKNRWPQAPQKPKLDLPFGFSCSTRLAGRVKKRSSLVPHQKRSE